VEQPSQSFSAKWVEQAFMPAVSYYKIPALAAEVHLTIPHRGTTTESTYFVTANVLERRTLFHVEKIASLFIAELQNREKISTA
jgi:hypothetical protein